MIIEQSSCGLVHLEMIEDGAEGRGNALHSAFVQAIFS